MANIGGIVGTVIGWLGYQMGLRTDAADASGSLHAKVKEGRNTISTSIGTSTDTRSSNTVMGWLNTPVKSIQRGETSVSVTGKDVDINSVDTAKAFVIAFGRPSSSSYGHGGFTAKLTSSSNLNLVSGFNNGNDSFGSAIICWQVIEFY